jgi:hypothetical protein
MKSMEHGHLIRVEKMRADATIAVAYIVAESDPDKAINLIRIKAAHPDDKVADVGPVSVQLLQALDLHPGDFVCPNQLPAR